MTYSQRQKSIEKVRHDYNKIATHYSQTRRKQNIIELSLQRVLPFLKPRIHILDLGCGSGKMYAFLQKHCAQFSYIGLDISENLIKEACKDFPSELFMVGDMTKAQTKNTYDLVCMVASFHHLPDRQSRLDCLSSSYQSLKPGGIVFMTNWNLWQFRFWNYIPGNLLRFLFHPRTENPQDFFIPWGKAAEAEKIERYYHAFLLGELANLAKKTGFEILENTYTKGNKPARIFDAENIVTVLRKPC